MQSAGVGEYGTYDAYVERVLATHPAFARRCAAMGKYAGMLGEFARWVLTEVDAQAAYTDRYARPALESYGADGRVANRIAMNERYARQHEELYRRGMIGLPYLEGAPHLLSFVMGYLLAEADISLHCPVTLTGAVAHVLAHYAPEAVRARYLPEMVRMDGRAMTGGTWATEHGCGSDLGATETVANPDGDRFRLQGLKWFASNAGGDLALATARPRGAAAGGEGLGLYLVPRLREDGGLNRYRIRRLKEKLGTRGLPTGEIELEGAEAAEVAPPPLGLKRMMDALEYSRIHNAAGAAGIERRALREALRWAETRVAFGRRLIDYPMVRDQLLGMRVRYEAGTLLALEAAASFDESLRRSESSNWMRLATALAKYLSAEDAITGCRAAVELIGGLGYTSDSPMERIARDAQVLTVWEGPANIQALEMLRMLEPRRDGAALYEERMRRIVSGLGNEAAGLRPRLEARLAGDLEAIRLATGSTEAGLRYARRLLERLSRSLAFALLCEMAAGSAAGERRAYWSAWRYHEEIDPPKLGREEPKAREAAGELLGDEPDGFPGGSAALGSG